MRLQKYELEDSIVCKCLCKKSESELSHVPERRSIIQTENNVLYAWAISPVFPPALFDEHPQLVIEPKARRLFRFGRPVPLEDRIYNQMIVLEFVVRVLPAQHLVYRWSVVG